MSEQNRTTVLAYYEAFAHGDLPGLIALLHPEVEFRSAENFLYADRNPYIGPSEVQAHMQRIVSEWDGFRVLPDEIQGAGDMVISRGHYLGTYKATGFRLNAEYVHVFKFKEGKIVLQHTYTDTAQFRDAVKRSRDSGETPTLPPTATSRPHGR